MTLRLYNVSFNLSNLSRVLYPAIPESIGDGENKTVERVCMSSTVAGCMQAIAPCNREIAVGKQFILRTYITNNSDGKVIEPSTLFNKKLVPDALENNEHWVLKPVSCSVRVCEILDFDYEFEIAWSCIPLSKCRDIARELSGLNFTACKTSKSLYQSFCKWANKNQKWDEEDEMWDRLAELPWAQCIKINNLKYRVIKELK